jgi:hypothetical protein
MNFALLFWCLGPYSPLYISFERSSNCAEHAIILSNMCLYFYIFTKVQYTIHCRKQGCFEDAGSSKKSLFTIQLFFQEVHFSSFSCAFMSKVYCFPASVLLFFNKAVLLRQNIGDAWKKV